MKADPSDVARHRERLGLTRDCARCFGLCCVGPSFKAAGGFPVDKPVGTPCLHLSPDFGCGIHADLAGRGFTGCVSYDCVGAGQRISQEAGPGGDWRTRPRDAQTMFQALPALRELHLWLWHLVEAAHRGEPGSVHDQVISLLHQAESLTGVPARGLSWGDVDRLGRDVSVTLREFSAELRTRAGEQLRRQGPSTGRLGWTERPDGPLPTDLRGADLRTANLREAPLRGLDLTGADLRWADLRDADLRRTNLSGADLGEVLFLTRSQLESARGDASTGLTPGLHDRPPHWLT